MSQPDKPQVSEEAVELARIAFEASRQKPTELAIADALTAALPAIEADCRKRWEGELLRRFPYETEPYTRRRVEAALALQATRDGTDPIPLDYWREVPCGHPPDPVAMYNRQGWPVCHCGCMLDTAGLLPAPPEAPGPLSHCQRCGCHVAIPPATRVAEGTDSDA